MKDIHDAILLAVSKHRGQKDKAGIDYIFHPLRIMTVVGLTDEERMVAVLHDLIEDTDATYQDLSGYPPSVILAVEAISRHTDETYSQYIRRVKENALATRIKLLDLGDNLFRLPFFEDPKEKESLSRRYQCAIKALRNLA